MDLNNTKPIFEQVADFIEDQILNGNLKVDDQIPSTNDFSKIYGINPATARKGMNGLVDEGIIYKKRGMEMYVTNDALKIIKTKRKEEYLRETLPNLVKNLKRLDINIEELIAKIHLLYEEDKND